MNESHKRTSASALALSPAHSSALTARLLILEEDCREIERFLDGYAGVFYTYLGVFPDETRRTIRSLIAKILRRISRLRFDLSLPQRQIEINKMLAAHLSRIWVTLSESKADSLQGYGVVPEELSAYLDPRVEELLALVASLRSAAESGKKQLDAGLGPDR